MGSFLDVGWVVSSVTKTIRRVSYLKHILLVRRITQDVFRGIIVRGGTLVWLAMGVS